MQVAFLVANPAASQFTGGIHRSVVRELSRRYRVEAVWPNSPDEAQAKAAAAAQSGAGLVVAMGGDGVVHHVAQGLAGSLTPMGIIPVGTTNVVARLIGLPRRVGAAVRILSHDFESSVWPVVGVDATTERGHLHRIALFSLGVGVDAHVVARAESEPFRKYRFGGVHYARTTLGTVWSDLRELRPSATVTADTRSTEAIGFMAQWRDAYTYFGRLPIRLASEAPDPLTLLVVSEVRMRRALSIARGAFGSGMDRVRGFEVWPRATSVQLRASRPVIGQADGELIRGITAVEASYRPEGVVIATPPHESPR